MSGIGAAGSIAIGAGGAGLSSVANSGGWNHDPFGRRKKKNDHEEYIDGILNPKPPPEDANDNKQEIDISGAVVQAQQLAAVLKKDLIKQITEDDEALFVLLHTLHF